MPLPVVWPTEDVLVASEAVADQGGEGQDGGTEAAGVGVVDAGWPWAQAGREVGVAKTTAGTWIKEAKEATVLAIWRVTLFDKFLRTVG